MCMKKQTLVRDAAVMLLALLAAYAMVMLTQAVMGRIEGVAMLIFMLAVFVTTARLSQISLKKSRPAVLRKVSGAKAQNLICA